MDIIDLTFKIIRVHVPMNQDDYARLLNEATDWKAKAHSEDSEGILKLYAKVHKPWIVRLILAVAYIPLTRLVTQWKMAAEDSSDNDN